LGEEGYGEGEDYVPSIPSGVKSIDMALTLDYWRFHKALMFETLDHLRADYAKVEPLIAVRGSLHSSS
jgi:hypothetical protein